MTTSAAAFPCERALAVGDLAVLVTDVLYCVVCAEAALLARPSLVDTARRVTLRRGITCGGGNAED